MYSLFFCMVKEEWRIHSTMFGNLNFILFPIMICGMAIMGSFLLPLVQVSLPPGNLSLLLHANYLLLGFMAGAFGLLGNEAMNRRFGQASLLAYAARSLPLSDRYIFTTFVLKDTFYYFMLWVFPLVFGFFLASGYIGIPITLPLLLALTLTLSFLFGLCLVFFLSVMYSRSKMVMYILLLMGAGSIFFVLVTGTNPAILFPPLMLFYTFSWELLILSSAIVIVLFIISLLLFTPDSTSRSRQYRNVFTPLVQRLSFLPFPALMVKDLIDLYRSGRVIGQTLFSFLIPLVVIWFFLSLTSGYLPSASLLLLFAIITGVISSTMYTWLTSFDTFSTYSSLPLGVRTVIMSKISGFMLLSLIPVAFLSILCLISNLVLYLVPALVLCMSVSFFSLALTVWLTGLYPDVLIYHVRVMIVYFLCIGIVTSVLSSLAFTNPVFSFFALILFIPSWILIHKGSEKWEMEEQPVY